MTEKLTEKEIEQLKEVADDSEKWDLLVDTIKRNRGGSYPPDWYTVVIAGKIIKDELTSTFY